MNMFKFTALVSILFFISIPVAFAHVDYSRNDQNHHDGDGYNNQNNSFHPYFYPSIAHADNDVNYYTLPTYHPAYYPTYQNYNYSTPSYNYSYNYPNYSYTTYPNYSYYQTASVQSYQVPTYTYYPSNQYVNNTNTSNGLGLTCSVDPVSATVGQPVTWTAVASGGTAPYTYSWSGSGGLSGSQSSVTNYYNTPGQQNALISVTSANGLTSTHACSISVVGGANTPATVIPQDVTPQPQPQASVQDQNSNANAAAAGLSILPISLTQLSVLIIFMLLISIAFLMVERRGV